MRYTTPLRYPGGKGKLADFVKVIFEKNGLLDGHYAEPYAGGAAVAFSLLFEEYVSSVYINDIDLSVYAFWHSVINETEQLCRRVKDTRVDMKQWERQRAVQQQKTKVSLIDLGFSTFFLNRTNRSGIIKGGVIGGRDQTGAWKIDARYNKDALIERIEQIGSFRDRINIYNLDASEFVSSVASRLPEKSLVYLDPPYFVKGHRLYANFYRPVDHASVASQVGKLNRNWMVSYDNAPEIKKIYRGYRRRMYGLDYSAGDCYRGVEVMFFSPGLKIPRLVSPSGLEVDGA